MAFFPTQFSDIYQRLKSIDPEKYSHTRNYVDGAVTYLSPYISRGVISTKTVFNYLLEEEYPFETIEKYVQELAWRDYWQQVWIHKKSEINTDLKSQQQEVQHYEIPTAILTKSTSIEAIDSAIKALEDVGYMHNHMRMYAAAVICNVGKSHWLTPSRWMYYHLLDGDWASNALSWQWVAGSNASKKYYANQANINKFFNTNQRNTFLDYDYDVLVNRPCPTALVPTTLPLLKTELPVSQTMVITPSKPILVYNYYNLDPNWRHEGDYNRVLLLEPKIFKQYPIAPKNIQFMQALGVNIKNLQVYVGSFEALSKSYPNQNIIYKEHPLNAHYVGTEDARDWMFDVQGYFPSFFAFWKKCKTHL